MSNEIHVATRKGLFTLERGPKSWAITRTDFIGDNVSTVLVDPRDGAHYAALEHGHFGCKLHRRAGAGQPWQEIGVPAYPKQPDGEIDKDPMGRVIPWSLVKVWVLEPGGANEPGVLWAGTLPGGLFRSADHGATWQLNRPLWDMPQRKYWLGGGYDVPGIHSICLDPSAPGTMRVGVSTGGIWLSRDGGHSWTANAQGMRADYVPPEFTHETQAQDIHRLAHCPAAPDTLWVQHHNGIFTSNDGGTGWREIKSAGPSVFGFAAAVHPKDPRTAWFVPAIKDERRIPVDGRMVVTRTRDGARTFETLSAGLPRTHAYHLVYRHGLAVDATGERLAIGSTTGGLWISENQGDSWTCVSNDLPPVHGVRFLD